jgi:hypothetical protein
MAFVQGIINHGGASIAPLARKYDADGSIWVMAYPTAGATKKNPYSINYSQHGWTATAIADVATVSTFEYIGVAKATYASGIFGWFQIGGYCSDVEGLVSATTTRGHQVEHVTDTITTGGASADTAATSNNNCFAVWTTTDVAGTTHDMLLFPVRIDCKDLA